MSIEHNVKTTGKSGDEITQASCGSGAPTDYEFTALIKTKQGHYFHQNYQGVEDFRQKMKEQENGIVWGVLMRCDTGISVDLFQTGQRQKIGLENPESGSVGVRPEGLNPVEAALREATIEHFKSKKMRAFMAEQVEYINPSRQVGEGIRFLLDAQGRPSENTPIEDIIEERDRTEIILRWLEAICSALRDNLATLKGFEDSALELLRQDH